MRGSSLSDIVTRLVRATSREIVASCEADASSERKYRVVKTLGKGSYSRVYLATNVAGEQFAVKVVQKARLKEEELARLHRETSVLASLRHPHVIRYVEHFEDRTSLFLVTEYLPGGELFERIVARDFYSERDVRTVMRTLLETIKYCHDRGVVHRDIKPENILLESRADDAQVKLADFGFAKKLDESSFSLMQTACGTPGYVAPEILSTSAQAARQAALAREAQAVGGSPPAPAPMPLGYDKRVDIWSLGVVCFIMLCGYPPFREKDRAKLFRRIKTADYVFDSPWWDPVSPVAKDFVARMLQADPDARASVEELLAHEFMVGTSDRDISASLPPMRDWNAKRKVDLLKNTWRATVAFKSQKTGRRLFGRKSTGQRGDSAADRPRASTAASAASAPPENNDPRQAPSAAAPEAVQLA